MAKTTKKADTRPLGADHSWARTPGTYLAGRSNIDGVDALAHELEKKWGAGRLRLLVDPELREKFDRQRYKLNQAIWHGDLEALRLECSRMINAWRALDRAAEAAGASKLSPLVWETTLDNGAVVAVVRDGAEVNAEGRHLVVYTLEEVGRILSAYPSIVDVKETFPGATVTKVSPVEDPLNGLRDSELSLDDPIDDVGVTFAAG